MVKKYYAPYAWLFVMVSALCLSLLSACRPNPRMQGNGEGYLQGEWQQKTDAVNEKLLTYTLYHFKFSCDSVFVTQQTFSKVNYGTDTCMNAGHWTEYAKARYEQRNDTLHIKGFFTDARYHIKSEGSCFRYGVYEEMFKVNTRADSALTITSTANTLPIHLQLIKRTNCTPKPL